MARSGQFTQADITERQKLKIDPSLVGKLAEQAGVPDTAKENFAEELELALRVFKLRILTNKQERSTRIISTLAKGMTRTNELLRWLRSLPLSVRFDLKAGGTEELLAELVTNINNQTNHYKARVARHRPFGAVEVRLSLQRNLTEIHQRYCAKKNDRQREAWVASALSKIKVSFPNEKKNRKLFNYGYHAPPRRKRVIAERISQKMRTAKDVR